MTAHYWHPRHRWRRPRIDRTQLWPVVTLGWWTVELLPAPIGERIKGLLDEFRRKL